MRSRSAEPGHSVTASTRSTRPDRKSTRLNSSHDQISYAAFCLKQTSIHSNPPLQHTQVGAFLLNDVRPGRQKVPEPPPVKPHDPNPTEPNVRRTPAAPPLANP